MGSHGSHEMKGSGGEASGNGSGGSTPRGSRSGSGGDLQGLPEKQEKPPPSMVPVEKLAKLLVQISQKEDGINGVTENSFKKYLFPMYGELASHFFGYMLRAARCRDRHVPLAAFRQHAERLMSMLDDALITETYVRYDKLAHAAASYSRARLLQDVQLRRGGGHGDAGLPAQAPAHQLQARHGPLPGGPADLPHDLADAVGRGERVLQQRGVAQRGLRGALAAGARAAAGAPGAPLLRAHAGHAPPRPVLGRGPGRARRGAGAGHAGAGAQPRRRLAAAAALVRLAAGRRGAAALQHAAAAAAVPRRRRAGVGGVAVAAGVRGAVALGAAVHLARPRPRHQPLPAPHARIPGPDDRAAAGAGAGGGGVQPGGVARLAPVLGRQGGGARAAAARVRRGGARAAHAVPEHGGARARARAARRRRPAQAAAGRRRRVRHAHLQERALQPRRHRGVGLRRPRVARPPARGQEVAGEGGRATAQREAVGGGLDRAPRPLPAGAGRPPAVQQLRQLVQHSCETYCVARHALLHSVLCRKTSSRGTRIATCRRHR